MTRIQEKLFLIKKRLHKRNRTQFLKTTLVDRVKCKMLFIVVYALCLLSGGADQECQHRDYGNGGTVCVCNSTYCDTVSTPQKIEGSQYIIYKSSKAGLRFNKTTESFVTLVETATNQIFVDSIKKFQRIEGYGGAFTDAAGVNINSLNEEAQNLLLKSYFSSDGIGYSVCRVPIGGTDFSTRSYSYDDGAEDKELKNFQLAPEDFQLKIPHIKTAQNLSNGKLLLFASAWTAPKWMKTNGEHAGFGFLKWDMYEPWANYFVKFLDEYKKEGIDFWGITTGNEPSLVVLNPDINSVGWTPAEMGTWILNNLGPVIRKSNHSSIKLMILDDQRAFLPSFVDIALLLQSTRNYVDGIAVHWYSDQFFHPSLLTITHQHFPEKFILGTEACTGLTSGEQGVPLGSWSKGEEYSVDIIEDMSNWVVGWVDWNMALNLEGGPTYISNFVDSPIIVNETAQEFYKQPMYYHLGHFSKFVPRDSYRIFSSGFDSEVPVTAFKTPDNGTIVVILNKKEEVVPVAVTDESKGTTAQFDLDARSVTTLLYW